MRTILDGQQCLTATFRSPDYYTLDVRSAKKAEPNQRTIYDSIGVAPTPRRRPNNDRLNHPIIPICTRLWYHSNPLVRITR